jgi:hypothetical protein
VYGQESEEKTRIWMVYDQHHLTWPSTVTTPIRAGSRPLFPAGTACSMTTGSASTSTPWATGNDP